MESKISTNVRSFSNHVQRKLDFAKRKPEFLAAVAENLFFTPTRSFPSRKEKDVLATGVEKTFRMGNREIHYWHWDRGGELVFLVHGWNGHSGNLSRFVEPLLAEGFSIVSFDLPGHGVSGGRHNSLPLSAQTLIQLTEIVGVPYAFLAHSFGGAIATLAMEKGLEVKQAVYISPPLRLEDFRYEFCNYMNFDFDTMEKMKARIEKRFNFSLEYLNTAELGKNLNTKLLVIHDKDDDEVPYSKGEKVAKSWKSAELISTEGLGHKMILRSPDIIEKTIRFIKEGLVSSDSGVMKGVSVLRV